MVNLNSQPALEPLWQIQLSDYITDLTWSGVVWAAATAAGEVVEIGPCGTPCPIRPAPKESLQGQALDVLQFSADGQYLAAAGPMGLLLWRCQGRSYEPIAPPESSSGLWIEQLAWHPHLPLLAYGLGRVPGREAGARVEILDLSRGDIVATLPIDNASVTALTWQPQGKYLALGDYRQLWVWDSDDWGAAPIALALGSAAIDLAWSPDGLYLAAGNLDRNLIVWRWGQVAPWQMRGFPGKVRRVVWSLQPNENGVPYVAVCSQDGVVIWSKDQDDDRGWQSEVLELHESRVNGLVFGPQSTALALELASAGEEGWVGLWRAGELMGVLDHEGAVVALDWGELGLVTATDQGVISLWPGEF